MASYLRMLKDWFKTEAPSAIEFAPMHIPCSRCGELPPQWAGEGHVLVDSVAICEACHEELADEFERTYGKQ